MGEEPRNIEEHTPQEGEDKGVNPPPGSPPQRPALAGCQKGPKAGQSPEYDDGQPWEGNLKGANKPPSRGMDPWVHPGQKAFSRMGQHARPGDEELPAEERADDE